MRFVSGVGGGGVELGWVWGAVLPLHGCVCVRVCSHLCCALVLMHMCMHACLSVCALLPCRCMRVYACAYVCVCFIGCWGAREGGSHGAALCLSHLPPHSTDTQGNGREGGEFILKEGLRVQRPNGQQCGFLLMARGKGQWRCVWKPIYQSL